MLFVCVVKCLLFASKILCAFFLYKNCDKKFSVSTVYIIFLPATQEQQNRVLNYNLSLMSYLKLDFLCVTLKV